MKFEEDFDFETANAQFHKDDIDKELQSKLKLKGNTVAVASKRAAHFLLIFGCLTDFLWWNSTDDKPLNGEETADTENVTHEEEETAANSCYYDKSKSFFDNLSCDDPRYLLTHSLGP